MIKKYWVYGLFVFAVAFFLITRFKKKEHPAGQIELTAKTFKTDLGWGYDIYTNDSVYIHQEFIPGIEGRKGFVNEEEAKKIAELVLNRMKTQHQRPPVFISDLDSLKITR